jgi:hypothetical protein
MLWLFDKQSLQRKGAENAKNCFLFNKRWHPFCFHAFINKLLDVTTENTECSVCTKTRIFAAELYIGTFSIFVVISDYLFTLK